MTIAFATIGTASTSSTLVTITIPAGGVPSGAVVVMVVENSQDGSTGGTVTDGNNTYAAAVASGGFYLWHADNVTALSSGTSLTFNAPTATPQVAASALYLTGCAATSPLDTAVTASSSSSAPSVTSGTPSVSGEGFVAASMWQATSGTTSTATRTGSWATPPSTAIGNSGAFPNYVFGGSQVNSGVGTIAWSPTVTNVAAHTFSAVVGFKPSGSAATTRYPLRMRMGIGV